MNTEWIRIIFAWGPTVLFLIGILSAVLLGMVRGLRKSSILFLHAGIAFLICIITYLILINMDSLDEKIVGLTNSILGKFTANSLQNLMGVSEDATTLTQILVEFIPKNFSFGNGFQLIIQDNGAYLATLVNITYHIILALLLYIVYFILLLFMYILYFIFYPERRYKRKQKRAYRDAISDRPYQHHGLLGGLIGGIRGLIGGLIGLSFLGSLLFIIGGGIGDHDYDKYPNVYFEEDNTLNIKDLNEYYEIYKCLGSYGSQGVFKVLNTFKDTDKVPFYLYAADLVFSGGLTDNTRGIDQNIYLRREIGAYTEFSMKTLNLLMKYGSKEISDFINKKETATSSKIMDVVIEVMKKDGFQEEFDKMIDTFNSQTYFINFSLSLVDSIASHIEEDISFLNNIDQNTKKIIEILFDKETGIKVSALMNKKDVNSLLKSTIQLLQVQVNEDEGSQNVVLRRSISYGQIAVPIVLEMSIFQNPARLSNLNGVLKNLYEYFADFLVQNTQQTEVVNESVTTKAIRLANVNLDQIDWVAELKELLSISLDALNLYDKISVIGENNMVNGIFELFAEENEDRIENEKLYDSVTNGLGQSKLVGVILSMSFFGNMVQSMVKGFIPDAQLPTTFDYANILDSNGEIVQYGEVYNLLTTLKFLAKNENSRILFESFSGGENTSDIDKIKELSGFLNDPVEEGNSKTILDQILESQIFEYAISGYILGATLNSSTVLEIYVPLRSQEVGKDDITIVKKEELKGLFKNLPVLIDLIQKNEELDINVLIHDETLPELLRNSSIIEGTISKMIHDNLAGQDEVIVVPTKMHDIENWLSKDNQDGEALVLLDVIRQNNIENVTHFDMNSLKINATRMTNLLRSTILHYTISKHLIDKIGENDLPSTGIYETNITEYKVITTNEIIDLTKSLEILFDASEEGLTLNEMDFGNITITKEKLDQIVESKIVYRKISSSIEEALDREIPGNAYNDPQLEYIKLEEIHSLIDLIGNEGAISIGGENPTDFAMTQIEKSKFEEMAESHIIRFKVSKTLESNDGIFIPDGVKENDMFGGKGKYINKTEFLQFLNSFSSAYGDPDTGNIEVNDSTNLTMPSEEEKYEGLTNSVIVRATITQNLEISCEGNIEVKMYAEINDIEEEYTDMPVLTQDELIHILTAIHALNPSGNENFIASLDLQQIAKNSDSEAIYKLTCSDTIRLMLNSIIQKGETETQVAIFNYETICEKDKNPYTVIYSEDEESKEKRYSLEEREISLNLPGDWGGFNISGNQYGIPQKEVTEMNYRLYNLEEMKEDSAVIFTKVDESNHVVSSTTQETLQAYFTMLKAWVPAE